MKKSLFLKGAEPVFGDNGGGAPPARETPKGTKKGPWHKSGGLGVLGGKNKEQKIGSANWASWVRHEALDKKEKTGR